jgi:serine/threonine protein kinase/Tfp pilus assembly protein PilF
LSPDDRALADLAASVADGAPVDWQHVQDAISPSRRALIRHLRLVESISHVYRTLPDDGAAEARAAAGEATRWGPLVLLERIGEGTSGEVYRAWDPHLQRDVALKLLSDDRTDAHRRVLEEARRLARIRHEHVVHVYGAEEHEGRVGMWMELVRGESLDDRVRSRGPLSPPEAALIGSQLCSALSAVHAAGLLHRDVKAQNVILEGSGRTVLMDFGTGEPLRRSAGTNRMVGTPLYLAPEVFKGQAATVRSDIYSLGVLLFYLVTGQFPVWAPSMQDLGRAHGSGARRRLPDLQPGAPAAFVNAVERALDNDPARRHETAAAMERALRSTVERPATSAPRPASRWRRFAVVAILLLAVTAALVVLTRGRTSPSPAIRRIAVLPLSDLSPGTSPPYLAGAITDRLIASLARVPDLQVTSPSSANQFKDSGAALHTIAQTLHVDGIVQGTISVQPAPEGDAHRVYLNTRLIAAGTGAELWTGTFAGTVGELEAMQAEVVAALGERLRAAATPAGGGLTTKPHQTTPKAEAAYLAGRYHLGEYGLDSVRLAAEAFSRAVELDQNHALARADLARCYLFLSTGGAMPPAKGRMMAAAEVKQALAIDDGLAEAHAVRADLVFHYDWDWREAERAYRRAIELDPSAAFQRTQFARFLAAARRLPEALEEVEAARRLDPLSAATAQTHGLILFYARRYEEAENVLRQARLMDPQDLRTLTVLGRVYEAQARYPEALEMATRAMEMASGPTPQLRVQRLRLQALSGRESAAREEFKEMQREVAASGVRLSPEQLAYLELAFGNRSGALQHLERALEEREAGLLWIAVDPRVDPLRAERRFHEIVRTLGVP